jgi:hypothetical protein
LRTSKNMLKGLHWPQTPSSPIHFNPIGGGVLTLQPPTNKFEFVGVFLDLDTPLRTFLASAARLASS